MTSRFSEWRWRYVSVTLPAQHGVPDRTRIQLCGRLSVEIDGQQRAPALRGRQVPLVLAYLALNRERDVGRDELSDALWPRQAPQSQDGSLRTLLSRLRSALGADVVPGRERLQLALPEPVWIDFEAAAAGIARAREALAMKDARAAWALAQVPFNISGRGMLPGAQADWLEPRRRELETLRLQALELIGRAGLMLGGTQLASAQRAASSLIEAEPYRESGYVLLMEALAAEGNVAEGLRAFERLRTLLRDELGTTPSRETIAAHDRLLHRSSGAAGARARTSPARSRDAMGIELPGELRRAGALVGRGVEMAGLERLWRAQRDAEAETEASPIVLFAGEPGIGKSRLTAEFARRVHAQGAIVLFGRSPQEPLTPYQPFLEALRHYISQAALADLQATAGTHGTELQRVLPELRQRLPDLRPPAEGHPETERYRLFEAVVGLLAEIAASSPLLLVLDDLHWADRPTLLLLRHLARAPSRVPILGCYRLSEAKKAGPFADALTELRREQLVTEFQLHGLSEDEVAELIRSRTNTGVVPPLALVRALHEQTEGNPLFVSQIVGELAGAGIDLSTAGPGELRELGLPEGVRSVIAHRLHGLGGPTEEWLRTAAVIGRDFDAALVERVVPLDEERCIDSLEEALAAGVVVEHRDTGRGPVGDAQGAEGQLGRGHRGGGYAFGYSFSHVLIRETLYEDMSARRRAMLHRRVGEALERLDAGTGSDAAPDRAALLAEHFTRAAGPQDVEKAIRYATRAGEHATAMLAYEQAADHHARALSVLEAFTPQDEQQRLHLLLALGEAYVRSGDQPLAWQPLREAADIAIRRSDPQSLARAAFAASRRYVQPPGVVDEELLDLIERALEMTAGQRTTLRVRLLARACGAFYYSPQRARMEALAAEATDIAHELDLPEPLALAAAARRRAYWEPARLVERLSDSTELLRFAREAGDVELTLQGHAWLVVDLLEHGDVDAVEAQIEAFTSGADRLRQPLYLWQAAIWRVMQALLAGRLEQAGQVAQEALALGARAEAVTAGQYYGAQLLAISREQGQIGGLEPAIRRMLADYPSRLAYRAGLALLLVETGRPDEARSEISTLDIDQIPKDVDWLTTMTLLADVCAELGDVERAKKLYTLLLPYAEVNVVIGLGALCEGAAARHLGRVAAVAGSLEDAARQFERALERNEALGAIVCLTRTRLDYAQALGGGARAAEGGGGPRAEGRGGLRRARELLDAASSTLRQLPLPALAQRAQRLEEILK